MNRPASGPPQDNHRLRLAPSPIGFWKPGGQRQVPGTLQAHEGVQALPP